MAIKFGTSGFRAIMGEDFTKQNVQKIIQAVSDIINKENLKKEVFIGYDNRFMSEQYAEWAAQVFAGNIINVKLMKKASITPVVNYYAKKNMLDFSVAITASHNPYQYNGIKVFGANGKDTTTTQTKQIENETEHLKDEDIKVASIKEAVNSGLVNYVDIEDEYLESLLNLVEIKNTPKVCFDAMFGSSTSLLEKLIKKIDMKNTKILNDQRNAFFNFSMPSPNPETLTELYGLVTSGNYELGLALDGDGDRLAIIDKNGNYVDNSNLMACLYYFFSKHKNIKGDIVKTISTSNLLDVLATKFEKKCHTVNVGFKYVSEKMLETNAILGGESSGGLAILAHILTKDSLLSIVLTLEMISVMNKSIDEILEEVKTFANFHMNLDEKQYSYDIGKKQDMLNLLFLEKCLPAFNQKINSVEYSDYIKIFFEDGSWHLLRFSGTEPVLRIYCENETKQEAEKSFKIWQEFLSL